MLPQIPANGSTKEASTNKIPKNMLFEKKTTA
jgi:hypothetical protein